MRDVSAHEKAQNADEEQGDRGGSNPARRPSEHVPATESSRVEERRSASGPIWVHPCVEHKDHPELASYQHRDPDDEERQKIGVPGVAGEDEREYRDKTDESRHTGQDHQDVVDPIRDRGSNGPAEVWEVARWPQTRWRFGPLPSVPPSQLAAAFWIWIPTGRRQRSPAHEPSTYLRTLVRMHLRLAPTNVAHSPGGMRQSRGMTLICRPFRLRSH